MRNWHQILCRTDARVQTGLCLCPFYAQFYQSEDSHLRQGLPEEQGQEGSRGWGREGGREGGRGGGRGEERGKEGEERGDEKGEKRGDEKGYEE